LTTVHDFRAVLLRNKARTMPWSVKLPPLGALLRRVLASFLHLPWIMRGLPRLILAMSLFLFVHSAHADLRIDEQALSFRWLASEREAIPDPVTEAIVLRERSRLRLRHPFLLPAAGRVSSLFGARRDPLQGQVAFHEGIDIAASAGRVVHAAASGFVHAVGRMGGCGLAAVLDHGDGIMTRYCHLTKLDVVRGEWIVAGACIGRVGRTGRSTGPHLHFEIRQRGKTIDPAELVYF
jgi:murein DD-endopeptidase MepM/ murein hydrolase activator NlpD